MRDDTMLDAERKASPFCAGGAIVVAKCDVSHAKGCAQKTPRGHHRAAKLRWPSVRIPSAPPCSPGKPTRFPGRQKPSQFRSVREVYGGLRTEFRPFSLFCAQNRPPVSVRKIPFPAIEVQNGLIERNAGLPPERRIEFRVGIHLGDVVEEADGDLMGDGVNIAARLEGICEPGAICLSEDAYRQVKGRLDLAVADLGPIQLKNIAEPIRVYSLDVGATAQAKVAPASAPEKSTPPRLSIVVLPFANLGGDPEQEHFVDGVTESLTTDLSRIRGAYVVARNTAFTYKGKPLDVKTIGRELNVRYVLEGS